TRFLSHLPKDFFGDVRLVIPAKRLAEAVHLIDAANAHVEFERIAADYIFLTEIGITETARNHAANVRARFDENHLQSTARGADRGHRATGSSSVDNNIEFLGPHECGGGAQQKGEK